MRFISLLAIVLISFSANAYQFQNKVSSGGYDYILGTPDKIKANTPIVLLLHGCRINGKDIFDLSEIQADAESRGFVLLIPSQKQFAHMIGCWNFYEGVNQTRGGELSEVNQLSQLVLQTAADYNLDSSNAVVLGLSSGAGQAMNLFACYPEIFRGAGIHSGMAYQAATGAFDATKTIEQGPMIGQSELTKRFKQCSRSAKGRRLAVIHGLQDTRVVPSNSRAIVSQVLERELTDADLVLRKGAKSTYSYYEAHVQSELAEILYYEVDGLAHKWSGSHAQSQYADPLGPNATEMFLNFLL